MRQRIDIQIEELRLGDRNGEPEAIAEGIQNELGRLLGRQGAPAPASTRIDQIDAATHGSNPGVAVARAIHEGMRSDEADSS
ncbi:MAG: hypothetical protein O7C01_03295 [Actinobacteria bacterium]|nr:hypothetical protein [Actinomycetota bacterium]